MFTEVLNEFTSFRRKRPISEEEEFQDRLNDNLLAEKSDFDSEKTDNRTKFHKIYNRLEAVIVHAPFAKQKLTRLRDLRAEDVGGLAVVRGTVVRVTDVRPQMDVACYYCEECQQNILMKVNQATFMPPVVCASAKCRVNGLRGNIVQNFSLSKFVPYQELTI